MRQSLILNIFDLCRECVYNFPVKHNIGFVSGETGLLLCLYSLFKLTNKKQYEKELYNLLNKQFENIDEELNLGRGSTALYLTLRWIKLDYLIDDQIDDIDLSIEREYNLALNKNNLDYYHGASGYLFYFLMKNKFARLETLLLRYSQQVEKNLHEGNWYTPFYQKGNTSIMVINMGVPHGITGILLMLLLAIEKGMKATVTPTVIKICDFLLKSRFAESNKSLFPSIIKQSGEKVDSGIAWCYGDLMASYAILKTGLLLNDIYYTELGYQMLLQLNERTDYLKEDLCLCHGYASLIVIYKKIHQLTGEKCFKQRCDFFYQNSIKIFESKMKKYQKEHAHCDFFENPSLFAGFPGYFLSLLTWDIEDNDWEKCLLL